MDGTHLIAHIPVDHLQGKRFGNPFQPITPRQLAQLHIGIVQQYIERISLRYTTELGAVGRTGQFVQLRPTFAFRTPDIQFFLQTGNFRLVLRLSTKPESKFRLFLCVPGQDNFEWLSTRRIQIISCPFV